jgi:drug/metabolite transporter (DMT)-like permease
MARDDKVDFKLYRYTPSTTAAALFVALFFLTTIYHIYQLNRARAWYFIAFVIGASVSGALETGLEEFISGKWT